MISEKSPRLLSSPPSPRRQRPLGRLQPNPQAPLREQVREVMRFFHYSQRTEDTYWQWIVRYLRFHRDHPHLPPALSPPAERAEREKQWRHPRDMGAAEVAAYLSHLATAQRVSAATQNQALNALVFLYEQVLEVSLGDLGDYARPKRPARLPVVLSQGEVQRLLERMEGTAQLIARLLYGTGMRLMEAMRLRIHPVR